MTSVVEVALLSSIDTLPLGNQTLYAIAFDLVVDQLKHHYSASAPNDAYADIRAILAEEGFRWTRGSVHFGDPARVNAVTCVLAARRLATEFAWFPLCVRDLRMLRIEEHNDLMPALTARR
jgi:virulence-associated protein VapD